MLLGLWVLVATAAAVGWWDRVAKTLPDKTEAGGSVMVAVVQLAIATASAVGGFLFDFVGYRSTFAASAVLLLIAAVMSFLTSRCETANPP